MSLESERIIIFGPEKKYRRYWVMVTHWLVRNGRKQAGQRPGNGKKAAYVFINQYDTN